MTLIWQTLLDFILPRKCLSCEIVGRELCGECQSKIQLNTALFCGLCERRLAYGQQTCHQEAGFLLGAAADYGNEVIKNLIWQLKYRRPRLAAPVLAALLSQYLEILNLKLQNFLVVPIPAHPARLRWHKLNHTLLLAEAVQKELGLILADRFFVKIKQTKPQPETKSWKERMANVAGAFRVEDELIFRGRNILLVDDVFTSGATITEASRTLKATGAKRIVALVAARA